MKGGCRHHDRLKHSTLPSSWELRQSRISNTTTLVLKRPRLPRSCLWLKSRDFFASFMSTENPVGRSRRLADPGAVTHAPVRYRREANIPHSFRYNIKRRNKNSGQTT
ncbi:uncharacterized protein LOC142567368 isoform X1 [Dermacentor variabilis]|uniref:uncharacterized protein LOC142567368 isoform X1 n=1 Tax=Dermacentor variabilis TaxID=34621 RepID=UPI003F5C96D3